MIFLQVAQSYFELTEYLSIFYIWNLMEHQLYFPSNISSNFLNSLKTLGGYKSMCF